MGSLKDLLDGLGIQPGGLDPGRPTNVSSYVNQSPLATEARKRALAQLAGTASVPAAPVSGGNRLAEWNGLGSPLGQGGSGGDDGFGWGDIGSFLKDDVFGTAMDVVDVGRAGVAAVSKELIDAFVDNPVARWASTGNGVPEWLLTQRTDAEYDKMLEEAGAKGGFEWSDVRSQFNNRDGFGEIANAYNQEGGSIKNKLLGFFGDVASDPFTYVTLGGTGAARSAVKAAKAGADEAVLAAVQQGGRRELATALSKAAHNAGLADDVAVQTLIRDAATRGRGAITKRGLQRAGIDASKAELLAIPAMERQLAGITIKGTKGLANVVEDAKGAIKEVIGTSGAAKFGRMLRISDKYGQKRLLDIARSGASDPERASIAIRLLSLSDDARLAGRQWGAQKAEVMKNTLKDGMRQLNDTDASDLVDLLETGVHQGSLAGLADGTRSVFDDVLNDLQAAGVDVGELAGGLNYVPHMSTRAARMSDNAEIQGIIVDRNIGDRRAFQKQRGLKAGDKFLGETLQTGSIREINAISTDKLGFKVFEDDIREILPRYIAQAQEAMIDQGIRNGMVKDGIATPQRLEMLLSDGERAELRAAEKAAKKAWGEQTLALSDGTKVRYDSIGKARTYLRQQRKAVQAELEGLRVKVVENARNRTLWSTRKAVLEQEIPMVEKTLAALKSNAARLRGNERKAALRRVAKAQAALDVKVTELAAVRARLAALPEQSGNVEEWALRYGADDIGEEMVLAPEVAALTSQVDALRADADKLLQAETPLGGRDVPYERPVAETQAHLDWAMREVGRADTAVMDSRWADVAFDDKIKVAEAKLAEVQKALDAAERASKMLKPTKKNRIGAADHAMLRDEFQQIIDVMKVVAPSDNVALKQMVEAQLNGALQDMAALRAGRQALSAEDIVKAMRSKDFGSVARWSTDPGMWDIGQNMQAPGWIEDAFRVQAMIRDPKHFTGFADVFNWFQNQWKGYATMRPGFVARNAYSSTYSFYLEAGSAKAVKSALNDFKTFYNMYRKNPQGYMDDAVKRFGAETASRLDSALGVVAGTGGGLAPQEVASNVFRKGNWNPGSTEFHGIRATRALNERVEATIRGAHAYDVLRRGGDPGLAMRTVEKWHFNYKDITDFDRAAKKVIPFWMFYSNNLSLQAHVFTHDLAKFNRSYMNLRRQQMLGQEEEQNAPAYVGGINQIPLSINPQGESTYLPIDVGPTQFLNDIGTIGDPKKMVSDIGLSPLAGLPLQAVAGENLYTGAPNDRLRSVDPLTDKLMPWLQEGASGRGVMTQFQKDALTGLLPGLAQGTRASSKFEAGQGTDWLSSYLGFPITRLTPEQRKGVRYGDRQRENAARAKRELLAKL